MVSKKQRMRTIILILILAVAIVGGVFAVTYVRGGVTFPWQVAINSSEDKQTTSQPKEEPKLVIKEKKKTEEEPKIEVIAPKEEEATEEESTDNKDKETEAKKSDAAQSGVAQDYYGPLHVEDGTLVDADGNVAQLVGVSTSGLTWYPEFINEDSIKSMKDNWGINVIRLANYTSDFNGYCVGGADNKEYVKEIIDEAVKAATDNEMYVIIDWHILNDSNPNEYKSEAIQFFGEMVRKYESNENVIYEICNEPNGDTTWDDIKKYANEVIPVIRNIDDDALILVGTPNWSSDLDSVLESPLEFDNVMYTYHFYAGSHKASARNSLTSAIEDGLPVFISEYGFVSADGDGDVNRKEAVKWLEVIDEYHLSSCIWNLSNNDEGSALISADSDAKADWKYDDLSEQGQYFLDSLEGEKYTSALSEATLEEKDSSDSDDEEESIDSEESEDSDEEEVDTTNKKTKTEKSNKNKSQKTDKSNKSSKSNKKQ